MVNLIDDTGWLVGVTRHPGIPDKVFAQLNSGARGLALHSMEGTVAGSESRFMGPDQVSVMFENPKAGGLIQMYPVTASTWTSGCFTANTTTWAIESEGVAGEPLTDSQVANVVQVAEAWEQRTGRTVVRNNGSISAQTCWEHHEIYDWDPVNAGPTSCPSGRYARFYTALAMRNQAKEAPVTQPSQLDALNKALVRRFALIAIAGDPDSAKVDAAIAALQAVGLVATSL